MKRINSVILMIYYLMLIIIFLIGLCILPYPYIIAMYIGLTLAPICIIGVLIHIIISESYYE